MLATLHIGPWTKWLLVWWPTGWQLDNAASQRYKIIQNLIRQPNMEERLGESHQQLPPLLCGVGGIKNGHLSLICRALRTQTQKQTNQRAGKVLKYAEVRCMLKYG